MASMVPVAAAVAALQPAQAQRLGCGMHMTFYQSTDLTLWFSSWKTTGPITYAVALLGLFSLAAAQEALAAARAALAKPPPCCRCGAKREEAGRQRAGAGGAGATAREANGSGGEEGGLEAPLLSQQENGAARASPAPSSPLPPCCAARAASTAAAASPSSSSAQRRKDDETGPRTRKHYPTCVARAALSTLFATRGGSASLYAVHAAISYLLMLAAMTYNLGACAAVLTGLAAGHAATKRGAGAPLADACHAPRLEHARTLPLGAVP